MPLNKFCENIILTIPALLIGAVCAVMALIEPVRVLWCGEGE